MQAIPLLGRRLRVGDVLLGVAVLAVAIAVVVNGRNDLRTNHGTKRDIKAFNAYLDKYVGRKGFGNPRVKLRDPLDTVCATHRVPDYRLCARIDADDGKIVGVYKLVAKPGGGSQRVPFNPVRAGSSSAAQRSTQTGSG
jgi:hypothetical protein